MLLFYSFCKPQAVVVCNYVAYGFYEINKWPPTSTVAFPSALAPLTGDGESCGPKAAVLAGDGGGCCLIHLEGVRSRGRQMAMWCSVIPDSCLCPVLFQNTIPLCQFGPCGCYQPWLAPCVFLWHTRSLWNCITHTLLLLELPCCFCWVRNFPLQLFSLLGAGHHP